MISNIELAEGITRSRYSFSKFTKESQRNMQEMNEVAEELINLVKNLSLVKRSIESFFRCFKLYQEEDKDEFMHYFPDFTNDGLTLEVKSISYCPRMQHCLCDSVDVNLSVFYGKIDVARYVISFTDLGKTIDDSFYILPHLTMNGEKLGR